MPRIYLLSVSIASSQISKKLKYSRTTQLWFRDFLSVSLLNQRAKKTATQLENGCAQKINAGKHAFFV